jgi:hypothetical protein
MLNAEQSVESELTEENEALEKNLPKCNFVHHKSHVGLNLGRRRGKPAANRLRYGTANERFALLY